MDDRKTEASLDCRGVLASVADPLGKLFSTTEFHKYLPAVRLKTDYMRLAYRPQYTLRFSLKASSEINALAFYEPKEPR